MSGGGPGARILIVEAEPALAGVLASAIEAQGYEVAVVPSGRAALAAIGEQRPNAIFLDSCLPDLDTDDVLRWIQTIHPGLPLVLLTGGAPEGEEAHTRRLGVAEILPKSPILAGLGEALATP